MGPLDQLAQVSGDRFGYRTLMATAFNAVLAFAAEAADVGGRGDNPSDSTGVITIVVIAALVLGAGLLLVTLFRRGRARQSSLQRRPDRGGRVGRVSQMRD